MEGELELRVPAESCFLALITGMVRDVGRVLGFEGKTLKELELALEEACTNVIEHGVEGEGEDTLEVRFRPLERGIELLVTGGKKPFRLSEVPEPDLSFPSPERPEGGLGVHFIRRFMDLVEQEEEAGGRQRLRMVKFLERRGFA